MAVVEEISKAIAAHGMWKARLRQAIDSGKSEFTTARVSVDNQCDFGKWLHALPANDHETPEWKKVRELHARFHKEAAKVLGLALDGHKDEADKCLAVGSQFNKISLELTGAMMEWKKAG